jgi:hypothetical protein
MVHSILLEQSALWQSLVMVFVATEGFGGLTLECHLA